MDFSTSDDSIVSFDSIRDDIRDLINPDQKLTKLDKVVTEFQIRFKLEGEFDIAVERKSNTGFTRKQLVKIIYLGFKALMDVFKTHKIETIVLLHIVEDEPNVYIPEISFIETEEDAIVESTGNIAFSNAVQMAKAKLEKLDEYKEFFEDE